MMVSEDVKLLIAVGKQRLEERRQAEKAAEAERIEGEELCRQMDYLDVQKLLPDAVQPYLAKRYAGDSGDLWQISIEVPGLAPISLRAMRTTKTNEWHLEPARWRYSQDSNGAYFMRVCTAEREENDVIVYGPHNSFVSDDWAEALAIAAEEGLRHAQLSVELNSRMQKDPQYVPFGQMEPDVVLVGNLREFVRDVVRTEING